MIFFSPSGTHMETLCYARVQSPVGSLILGVSEKGLRALEFDRGQFPPKAGKSTVWSQSERALADYAYQLAEYFAGTRRELTFRLDLHGTDFQLECWRALLSIPDRKSTRLNSSHVSIS